MAAGIDICNHVRTVSSGLNKVWYAKNHFHWQFAVITGFTFSNTFITAPYFTLNSENKSFNVAHYDNSKMKLSNQLVSFQHANENQQDNYLPINLICVRGTNLFHKYIKDKVGINTVDMSTRQLSSPQNKLLPPVK